MKVTAQAHPNIALIKYWGKRNVALNLPVVPSLSLTLSNFHTTTTVEWGSRCDSFTLNGQVQENLQAQKVFEFLDKIQDDRPPCTVISHNNFPTAAGLASSASAFAALAMAGCMASEQEFTISQMSALARQGSGSASRSLWGGWVEWVLGEKVDGSDSVGKPIAPQNHWDIRMIVAVVSDKEKSVSSTKGMLQTANTSPMFDAWCRNAQEDIDIAKEAIVQRDIATLGKQMEISTLKMFATMFTTIPSIRYWKHQTLAIVEIVEKLRESGIDCWYTMDAGPNVKILCEPQNAEQITQAISKWTINTHILSPGSDARCI